MFENIQAILVTLDTFQLLSGWLKEYAQQNIRLIFVTLDTFQLSSGWLKDVAPEKIRNNVDKISFANETRATTVEKNSNDFLIYLSFGLFILFIIYCVFNTDKKEYIQSTEL